MIWFHLSCCKDEENEDYHSWTCPTCRKMPSVLSTILHELRELGKTVVKLQAELTLKSEKCSELEHELQVLKENKQDQNKNRSEDKENKTYTDAVKHDLNTTLPCKSLLIGDSLIRKAMDMSFVDDIAVHRMGGAKISDITNKLNHFDTHFKNIYIVVGTNDCKDGNINIDDFEELLSAASEKIEQWGSVVLSSIPPRTDNEDINDTIEGVNVAVHTLCQDKDNKFADNSPTFYLASGDINRGFLEIDGLHLNTAGTKQLLQNMGLEINTEKKQNTKPSQTQIDRENSVLFKGPGDELSNFYPCTINIFGRTFQSTEAAFQYRKAIDNEHWEEAEKISKCKRAVDAKRIGNTIKTNEMWESKRTDVMKYILEQKVRQCPPI